MAVEINDPIQGKWHADQLETKSDPLIDSGTGRPYIIRQFDFTFKPGMKKFPTKQDLFNAHWPQIRVLLWSDGLVANEDVEPRVLMNKKKYKIILLCEPKFGRVVMDKPQNLQQILTKK